MAKKIIIDGNGAVFGRLCSFAAKKALEGNEIIILNSGKVIITGDKKDLIRRYSERLKKGSGHSLKGPKYSKVPSNMLKRGISGMLPNFRRGQGKLALSRVRCYDDIPDNLKEEKMIKINAPKKLKYMGLKELSERI